MVVAVFLLDTIQSDRIRYYYCEIIYVFQKAVIVFIVIMWTVAALSQKICVLIFSVVPDLYEVIVIL